MNGIQPVYVNLHYIPITVGVIILFSVFGAYIAAYIYGYIDLEITIISDALNFPPGSCIFGYGLILGSGIMMIHLFIRYHQLLSRPANLRPPRSLIEYGFWSGTFASLGTSFVGGFQLSNMPITHWVGATVAFGSGCTFAYIETLCTSYATPQDRFLITVRGCSAVVQSITFVLTLIGTNAAYLTRGEIRTPQNKHIGHEWLMLGAISEWILVTCTALFVASFARDFKHIKLLSPQVVTENEENHIANGKGIKNFLFILYVMKKICFDNNSN